MITYFSMKEHVVHYADRTEGMMTYAKVIKYFYSQDEINPISTGELLATGSQERWLIRYTSNTKKIIIVIKDYHGMGHGS